MPGLFVLTGNAESKLTNNPLRFLPHAHLLVGLEQVRVGPIAD
jgi:hypothetical protein